MHYSIFDATWLCYLHTADAVMSSTEETTFTVQIAGSPDATSNKKVDNDLSKY